MTDANESADAGATDAAAAPGTDVTQTVGEMRRLLQRLEEGSQADPALRALVESFRVNSRVLQYVHDAHVRLADALERSDRSEMVIQSTDALNRTFRQLHDAQDRLAKRLEREERSRPWRLGLAGVLAGGVVAAAGILVVRMLDDDLGAQVAELGRTQERIESGFGDAGVRLVDAIDRGLAANRVLSNENRAQHAELQGLSHRLATLEQDGASAAKEAALLGSTNEELEREIVRLRGQLVDRDAAQKKLQDLIEQTAAASAASTVTSAVVAAPPTPAPGTASQPEDEAAPVALDPISREVNAFLEEAGVIDLRLLHCDGIEEGALVDAVFELRTALGHPIGFHSADRARLEIDAAAATGTIVLEQGSTVERGVRTPFPAGSLRLHVPAVADGSWKRPELERVVTLVAAAAPQPAGDDLAAEPAPFDARPLLQRLNAALRADGYGAYEFETLGGTQDGVLTGVRMHHYDAVGALQKTVVAQQCTLHVDAEAGRVTFGFRDGMHLARGREVPFFRGAGAEAGTWTLNLSRADPARWSAVADEIP